MGKQRIRIEMYDKINEFENFDRLFYSYQNLVKLHHQINVICQKFVLG